MDAKDVNGTMDLTIESSLLKYAVNGAGSVTPTRSTLPVIQNVMFVATSEGKLQVSGTNTETSITLWVTAQVKDPGAITVPYSLLSKVIDQCPTGQEIHLYIKPQTMTLNIEFTSVCTDIKGIDPEEFPRVVVDKLGDGSIIEAANFKKMVQQVALAAAPATDANVGPLCGVNLRMTGDSISSTATDRYRLATNTIGVQNGYPSNFTVTAAALEKIAKAMNTTNPQVEVHVIQNSKMVLNVPGKLQVIASQLAGAYPHVTRIIPTTPGKTVVTVKRSELLRAIKAVRVFADLTGKLSNLSVLDSKVSHTAVDETYGNANVDIAAESVTGENVMVCLNAEFFQDAVEAFTADEIQISLNGNMGPVLLTSASEDEKLLHLLMPMKL